jgi:hypothetical protein
MMRLHTLLFTLIAACGRVAEVPLLSASAAAPAPAAALQESPLLDRVAVIGASASRGFGSPLGLADALEVAIVGGRATVLDASDSRLFTDPERRGAALVERALGARPTLVVAVDYLFWFGYGFASGEEDRDRRLERGLRLLERFDCELVLGLLPDMSPAVGRALMARQVPSASHLAALNRRIGDWAAARSKVHLLALDRLMIDLHERRAIEIGDRRVPAGQALLQRDQLHPTPQGLAVLAALVFDTLGRAPDAGPSPWLDVEELSERVQQAAAERQERTRRQREERRERRRSYRQ